MALTSLGQDPWSLLGVFFFQLFLLPSLPPASGTGGQGPMPRVKYHAGKCMVPGRHGWHCRDEGAEEGEGCARGDKMEWRNRDAREPWRGWEKGRSLEVQVDL